MPGCGSDNKSRDMWRRDREKEGEEGRAETSDNDWVELESDTVNGADQAAVWDANTDFEPFAKTTASSNPATQFSC